MAEAIGPSKEAAKKLKEAETATTDWLVDNLPAQKVLEFMLLLNKHLSAVSEFSQDCVMVELRKKFKTN